jgi:EAL domain-containing protein (putative c-di-GMP-specific phosphodiesterase class I)
MPSARHRHEFSFAFQPIVDIESHAVFAYEALVRGPANEPASSVLGAIAMSELHAFDRAARIRAIELAASLGLRAGLSLNFLPQSLECFSDAITSTIDAARAAKLAEQQVYLEVTEGEVIRDLAGFSASINQYRSSGIHLAIDDFGAGHSGLNMLAEFQPDVIKIDMHLVRDIDTRGPRQAIVRAVVQACVDLGIDVIAEGVETQAEYRWFKRVGVRLFQGHLFGLPGFESLPAPSFAG